MEIVFGYYNLGTNGSPWHKVLIGVFDNDGDKLAATNAFKERHQGMNYWNIVVQKVALNSNVSWEI